MQQRRHVYHTTEGSFIIPDQWREMLGEDVLREKQSISSRLVQLGFSNKHTGRLKKSLIHLVGKEFSRLCDDSKQKRLQVELRNKTIETRYGVTNAAFIEGSLEKQKISYNKFAEKLGKRARNSSTIEENKNFIESFGITPLEEVESRQPTVFFTGKCLYCGRISNFHFYNYGKHAPTKCPFCNPCSTVFERKLQRTILKSFKILPHFRLSDRKEIDILITELNVGLEINGVISHNSTKNYFSDNINKTKSQDYHLNKTLQAEIQGIELIHIWEHEPYKSKGIEFLKLRLEGKHLDFIKKVQQLKPKQFKLRRDFYPQAPQIPGYTYTWKPEIWHTDRNGKPLPKEDPKALVTYTTGFWLYTIVKEI